MPSESAARRPARGGIAALSALGAAALAAFGMTAAGIDGVAPAAARNAQPSPASAAAQAMPAAALPAAPAETGGRAAPPAPPRDSPVFSLFRTPHGAGLVLALPETLRRAGAAFSMPESPSRVGLVFALPESPRRDDPVAALTWTLMAGQSTAAAPGPRMQALLSSVAAPQAARRGARGMPDRSSPVAALPAETPTADAAEPVRRPLPMAQGGPAEAPPPVVHKPRAPGPSAVPVPADTPSGWRASPSFATVAARFDSVGYDLAAVRSAASRVPRVYLDSLPRDLAGLSSVATRKRLFVQAVLPIVLRVNEEIATARWRVERLAGDLDRPGRPGAIGPADREWLVAVAERYGAAPFDLPDLLRRMDIVPPSLALAQAAVESGWGTSRFVREGNALFGQYTYKSDSAGGMVPAQRDADRRHRVRSHDNLTEAVRSYVHNLNTHRAYEDFRRRRARLRSAGRPLDGHDLAGALERYSERRAAYVKSVRQIIRQNRLGDFDNARLNNRQWTAAVDLPNRRPT